MNRNNIASRFLPFTQRSTTRYHSQLRQWQSSAEVSPCRNYTTSPASALSHEHEHSKRSNDQGHHRAPHEQATKLSDAGDQGQAHTNRGGRQRQLKYRRSVSHQYQDERTRHIVADDLDATLEAHRAANRASVIRYYYPKDLPGGDHRPDAIGLSLESPRKRLDTEVAMKSQPRPQRQTSSTSTTKLLFTKQDAERQRHTFRLGGPKSKTSRLDTGHAWQMPKGDSGLMVETRPWRETGSSVESLELLGHESFEKDARKFESYMKPTPHEGQVASSIVEHVRKVVQGAFPSLELELIGSRATGATDALSDIDISIKFPMVDSSIFQSKRLHVDDELVYKTLVKLQQSFSRDWRFMRPTLARQPVPVLTLYDTFSNLKVQITRDDCSFARTEFVRSRVEKDENLSLIYHLLRHLLRKHNLLPHFLGGLHSYPLFVSIVLALEGRQHRTLEADAWLLQASLASVAPADTLVGKLLYVMDYLSAYMAEKLDSTAFLSSPYAEHSKYMPKSAIRALMDTESVSDEHYVHLAGLVNICKSNNDDRARSIKQSGNRADENPLLCLQDPARPSLDLGRTIFEITAVLKLFDLTKYELAAQLKTWNNSVPGDEVQLHTSLIDCFVSSNWKRFLKARKKLQTADTDPQPLDAVSSRDTGLPTGNSIGSSMPSKSEESEPMSGAAASETHDISNEQEEAEVKADGSK